MEGYYRYVHQALQKRATKLIGSWEEDKLFIRIKLYKSTRLSRDPLVFDDHKIAQRDFTVKFSHFKQQLSNNCGSDMEYEALISEHLKSMGVPQHEHSAIAQRVFLLVEAAVTPVDAVVVGVWDTFYPPLYVPHIPDFVPASRSSIRALEQVTLDSETIACTPSCAICLEDFEQEPVTPLPCRHHFHLHCIVQYLEVNHMCPLCRYSMPTQD
ncbi:hypothetical protein ACLB2K_053915 [Fragaria x ananassa]